MTRIVLLAMGALMLASPAAAQVDLIVGSSGTIGNAPIQVNGGAPNAAAVALVRNGYLTATKTGFTVSLTTSPRDTPGTALPASSYALTFNAPGA